VVALAFSMHSAITANGFISGITRVSFIPSEPVNHGIRGSQVPTGSGTSGELLVHGRDGKFRSRDNDRYRGRVVQVSPPTWVKPHSIKQLGRFKRKN
jgi:hypothetical protein